MKKFTALLLAILMIGGMLPTVFAADAVTDPIYMFTSDVFGVTSGSFNSANAKNPDRAISTGFYEYAHQVNLDGQTFNVQHAWPFNDDEAELGNSALILKATVDKTGTYDAAIEYARYGYTGKMGVYFVPASWLEANYTVKNITDIRPIITNENAVCFVRDLDTHKDAGSDTVYNASNLLLAENDYYIFITIDKSDYPTADLSSGDGRYYSCIKSISLTSKAFASAVVSDSKLKPGETSTITVAAEDKSGSSLELSGVTYKSSDENVATVSASGVITAVGKGDAIITAMGVAGDVTLLAAVPVSVSFDYIYSFTMEAVPGATAAVPVSTITSFGKLDPEVSTGDYYYVANKNFSTFSLYSGGTQCYSLGANTGDSYIILRGKVDEPGVYDTLLTFSKATYGGRLNIYVVPMSYADNKWTMTSNALNIGEMIADSGVTKVVSVDCHANGTDSIPTVGATLKLPEKDFYFVMTTEMGAAATSDDRYYGLQKELTFECKGTLNAELSDNIKRPGESAKLSVTAKDSSGKAATPENVEYKSSNDSIATVTADGTVTIKGEGVARITTTATVGGIEISADTYINGRIIWDPNYVLNYKAVKSATADIKNGLGLHQVTELYEDISTGKWTYTNALGYSGIGLYDTELVFQSRKVNFGKNAVVLELAVDKDGTYIPTMTYDKVNYAGKVNAYLLPKSFVDEKGWRMTSDALPIETIESEAAEWRFASANGYSATATTATATGSALALDETTYLMLVLHNNEENIINDPETSGSRLWGEIKGVSLLRTGSVTLLAGKTELTKGDTTELRTAVKDNRDNAATAEVTFESLNTAVATVSGSTVEAVAPGIATIKATATVDGVVVSDTVEITVGEETADKNVSFAAYSSINGVKVNGTEYEKFVDDILRGTEMTVSAPEVEGYKFRYWVRGSADNGKWISNDSTYSFTLMTNTMLTAVYDEIVETEDKQVEFWNQNGTYIDTVAVANGEIKTPTATLTGFTFSDWYVGENEILDVTKLTEAVTRAVARFNANAISGDVKFDGASESEVVYNKKIDKSVSGAKVWMRDGKIVGYGESYTYYVWGATEITYSTEAVAEKAPIVVLESGNDAWMIEYDAGDKQIVEAGIIFGESTAITVDACRAKATSQKNLSHGQFTATSDYSAARGYIIYKDNGNYIVKYSD